MGNSTVIPSSIGGLPAASGTIHTSAPLSGDGSAGSPATVAAGAITLPMHAAQAANSIVANATGGSASPTAVLLDPTLTLSGGVLSLASPLTLSNSGGGINRILTLNASVAGGDPAISFQSNGTEVGYIRVDTTKAINLVPGAGGTGVLWTPGESAGRFAWGQAGITFFGGALTAKQAVGNALTNNIALGTGTAGTLTNFAGSTYATDAPIIAGDLNQLAIKIAAIETALKGGYNLVSN